VTNQNKRRREPSGYREPKMSQAPPPRRGLLDGLFAPRVGVSPMPKIRTSITRGFATVGSTPVVLVSIPVVLVLEWVVAVAFGFQGPFTRFGAAFAVPPIGTQLDVLFANSVAAGSAGVGAIFATLAFRAALVGFVTTASVEKMRTGAVSGWTPRRMLRVWPVAIIQQLGGFFLLITGQIAGGILPPGLGLFAFFAAAVAGVYLLGFMPAIAADEDRRMTDILGRSVRAGRLPASGNLTLAALYTLTTLALVLSPLSGSEIGVNPTAGAWAIQIGINVMHATVAAALAYRYLSVASVVPEPAPRTPRGR
jgi:hypothetical protein